MEIKTTLIRKPTSTWCNNSNPEDWRNASYRWLIVLSNGTKSAEFDYFTGSGLTDKKGRPKEPTLGDLLSSLMLDASAIDQSFNDWCADLGYNNDSRKAWHTWVACQENGEKLIKVIGRAEFNRLREMDSEALEKLR